MLISALVDWLVLALQGAFPGVAILRGAPAWDRPPVSRHIVIEWREMADPGPLRVGQTVTQWAVQFAVGFVATNELELWATLDTARSVAEIARATIGGDDWRVRWEAFQRAEQSELTTEALRYAALTTVTFTR